MRVCAAEQFKESVSEPTPNTKYYLAYGRTISWANDSSPDVANTAVVSEYEVWRNMIGGKRILGNDMCHVIPRNDWTTNTAYFAYDDMSTEMYEPANKFHIITSDNNVYKCISNNSGAVSTVEPLSVNPYALTETSDGYVWKYMFTVSDADEMRFSTNEYVPVRFVETDDGSIQYVVQDEAISGQINNIIVVNPGSGYSTTSNLMITITGDGTTATARATLSGNTIGSIVLTNYGYDYTFANVAISGGGGSGATARAIISPYGGHGKNAIYELGAKDIIINTSLDNTEEGVLPATNDFRQISLIKDPLYKDGNVASNVAFIQAYTLTTVGTGDYSQDESVYQGTAASPSFYGRIVSWDSSNGICCVINTIGTPSSQALIGSNTSIVRYVNNIREKDFITNSGQILYINNMEPITRSSDQAEDFRIVVKF